MTDVCPYRRISNWRFSRLWLVTECPIHYRHEKSRHLLWTWIHVFSNVLLNCYERGEGLEFVQKVWNQIMEIDPPFLWSTSRVAWRLPRKCLIQSRNVNFAATRCEAAPSVKDRWQYKEWFDEWSGIELISHLCCKQDKVTDFITLQYCVAISGMYLFYWSLLKLCYIGWLIGKL